MNTGYISAHVYTSRGALPIESATVAVTLDGETGPDLIGFRVTNREGNIAQIIVEAPDRSISQSPYSDHKKGFASFDLRIEHPLFYTIVIKNFQVFSGVVSRQDIEMLPLEAGPPPESRVKTINVPMQDL